MPHFLLPYFQHTRDTILQSLRARFQKLSFSLCRQLTAYYHKRFLNNLPAIISVLRELGWREKLPDDFNKRAIKLVERLELTCRQLTAYYHKRFLNNLPAIISVLRELGWREKLPDDFNKRAIKLVERLELTPPRDLTSPEVNLSNRIIANFMASSF
ncbi:MAG: hypothetical protein ACOX2E_02970 [Syntrophaceticus sp.]